MTARTLDFDYQRLTGPGSNVGTADGELFRWDEYAATKLQPAFGRMVITNGVNVNSQIALVNYNISASPVCLVMAAPWRHLHAMVSWVGAGRVFGTGYKWRYRFKNSTTGDVSGLSPSPSWPINLGVETTPGADTYLGQNAYFLIPCDVTQAFEVPVYADMIQLFRNLSSNEDVWYLVEEKLIGSNADLYFLDDTTDDELALSAVTAGMQPNPSFNEGMLPQYVKSFPEATGRLELYGIRKMGPYRVGSVTVTVGLSLVTRTDTSTNFHIDRVGQRFRMLTQGGHTIDDPTYYTVVAVYQLGSSILVAPDIQVSTYLTSGAYTTTTYEILDDRDAGLIQPSLPGDPTSYDLLEGYSVGLNASEQLLHRFALRGIDYAQTNEAIYRLLFTVSLDANGLPVRSVSLQRVAPDGTVGFESACMTPYGWTFLHPLRGVLLFTGNAPPQGYETVGTTSPCVPLGSQSETEDFLPFTQFHGDTPDTYSSYTGLTRSGFEESLLSECRFYFDEIEHLLHVAYVPAGGWSLNEELVFNAADGNWRGPWRRNISCGGEFKNADGTKVFALADDRGNFFFDQFQSHDMLAATIPTARINTSGTLYVLGRTSGGFDSASQQEDGVPIILDTPSSGGTALQWTRIIDVIDDSTLVLETPAIETGNTFTFRIGAIRHFTLSAWINAGEPVQPKVFQNLRIGFQYADALASQATIGYLLDGNESLAAMTGEDGVPYALDPSSTAYHMTRAFSGSRTFAFALYGTSGASCDPKVTMMVADIRVDEGNA